MSSINQIASGLYKALSESDERKVKPYDVKATVLREEGNVVWVKIPGGVDETPVQKTNNANIGDDVMVRISGGRAWLLGNETSPATDNTVANAATQLAEGAGNLAKTAADSAIEAQQSAQIAYNYADQAHDAAVAAKEEAEDARGEATRATQYANNALDQLGIVEDVVGVLDLLQKNGDYRVTSDEEIQPSKWYFTRSGTSPDFVYSVVNTPYPVDYILTQDSTVASTKTYYTYDSTEDEYVVVENPVNADLGTYYEYTDSPKLHGYYELVGIDEAIQNYVSNQLVVTDKGLWLKRPDSTGIQTKVLLSATDGVVLYGTNGRVVGKYGETAQIGDGAGFHIEMGAWYKLTEDTVIDSSKTYYTRTGTASTGYIYTEVENPVVADIGTYYEKMPPELGFYDGQNKVAYVRNDKLFIEQSVVVKQMDVGLPYGQINPSTGEVGLGQWSWKVHPNSENPQRNNLYLKWIG